MVDYNCETILDPFQNVTCMNMQDNANWKLQALDFSFALVVLFFVCISLWITWKMVVKKLINLAVYVR